MPLTLTERESKWLKYAHEVVACDQLHLRECTGFRKPLFIDVGLDDQVRWPGNLGSNYEAAPLRVLCLGQIHNDRHLKESFGDFQSVLREFRDGLITPADFLVRCRREYEKIIPCWGPWAKFYEIVPTAVQNIAYANIAKCWAPADSKRQSVNNQPTMRACNKRFSVKKLVSLLEPELIVQVGTCDAIKTEDFGVKRVVVNNTNRPESKKQRIDIAKEIRKLFGDRL